MMTLQIMLFIAIFILLEFFESTWQKADTFYGVIYNNYKIYNKGIFTYFILNTTFIYSLFLAIYLNNFSFWMSCIIVLKFLDLSFRLHLVNKIKNDESISSLVPVDITMNIYFRYINVLIYPLSFIFAVI